MGLLFLSYCRSDLSEVEEIARVLLCGGIRTWQDMKSLSTGNTEAEIRHAIREECFSLLFHVTPDSLSSDFIRNVELHEAFKRFSASSSFSIVPLFAVPVDEANKTLQGVVPVDISTFNGVVLKPGTDLVDACTKLRRILLRARLKSRQDMELPIAIMTQQRVPGGTPFLFSFDLATAFEPEVMIDNDFWTRYFRRGLLDLKDALLEAGISQIRIISKAHISVGIAFGFIFRRVTGFVLQVLQDGHWWSGTDQPSPNKETEIITIPNDIRSRDLAVEISVSQDTQSGIQEYLKRGGVSFRAFLKCTPRGGISRTVIPDGSCAVTMAKEIAEAIRKAQGNYGTTDTHIFAAIPLGLAYLLGTELNACGRIHLNEYNKSKGGYTESWVLEATD